MTNKPDWLLIVAGGLLQIPAVNAAHELGYKVVVSDRNLNCPCANIADHFVELDTFDVEGHVEFVKHWPHGLAAVFTTAADPVVTVAVAAKAAGCHGLSSGIAQVCAIKSETRYYLYVANTPQPAYHVIHFKNSSVRDIQFKDMLNKFSGTSFIIKATGSSGSRGHTRLKAGVTRADVWKAISKAAQFSPSGTILAEELLTGRELSVETLWYNGVMIPLNAVERPFLDHPQYAIELGHYNPAVLDDATYTSVWDIMRQAGCAIGMHSTTGGHILKGDLILTADGPKVLELTPRLSGGFDSGWTSPLAHGVDYTKGALLLALGEPLEAAMPYFTPRWHAHAACIATFGPEAGGIIKSIDYVSAAEPWVNEVVVRFTPGDELPPLTDCTARVAFSIARSEYAKMARKWATLAAEIIKVEVE